MRGANSTTGHEANMADDFAMYDRLPAPLKRWLQDAPLNLGCGPYAAKLKRRDAQEAVIDSQENLVAAFTSGHREGTKVVWGDEHPMAQPGRNYEYQLTPKITTRTEKALRINRRVYKFKQDAS